MSFQPPAFRPPSRSMGLKLLLVCVLALLMAIPALFVFALLSDRTQRAQEVTREVGGLMGGPQTFVGPILAVPYVIPAAGPNEKAVNGVFLIYPITAQADAASKTEVRRRSIFKVRVWQADLTFNARFDVAPSLPKAPANAALDWERAEFLLGVSDPRGAKTDIAFHAGDRNLPLAPTDLLSSGSADSPGGQPANLRFFGAPAIGLAGPNAQFDARAGMKFSGAERLAVLAWGKTTTLSIKGDWPHPSFDGGFPTVRKQVSDKGFSGEWSVPFVARGVPAEGGPETLSQLSQTAMGVSFVEPANPYQSVGRSLKYAPMFLGLVFLAYFLFETTQKKRVHPAQYVLIGLAQLVFYLLLLSIAEQIGFDGGFAVAAVATVSLISAYAAWVFESPKQGLIALVSFSLLYGLIYVLMRLEDLALLVGALTSFAAIAAVMYFTRRIDWYGASASDPVQRAQDA